jgi:hypothetical protein
MSSSGAVNKGSAKKPVSPVRNIIGLIVLIALVAWCWLEYSAVSKYNAAVKALDARLEEDTKALPEVQEAEALIGKAPDGPGNEVTQGSQIFTQKNYTWHGLVKHHTLTAYYTKESKPALHHMETEEKKYQPEPPSIGVQPGAVTAPPKGTGKAGRGGMPPGGAPGKVPTEDPAKAKSKAAPKAGTEAPPKADAAKTPSDAPEKPKADEPKKDAAKAGGESPPKADPAKTTEPPK